MITLGSSSDDDDDKNNSSGSSDSSGGDSDSGDSYNYLDDIFDDLYDINNVPTSTITAGSSNKSKGSSGGSNAVGSKDEIQILPSASSSSSKYKHWTVLSLEEIKNEFDSNLEPLKKRRPNLNTSHEEEQCSICLSEIMLQEDESDKGGKGMYAEIVKLNRCSHLFHKKCIQVFEL